MSVLSPEQAKVICSFFLETIKQESEITKKVIRAVPEDAKSYKPEPTSRSAHELAWHIASAEVWFLDGILNGDFAMTGEPETPQTITAILNWYETNMADRLGKVAQLPADKLASTISFFGIMNLSAAVYLSFLTHHSAHHRGQLSAYLRPMGGKVPSIYGGSADEPFQAEANA